MSVTPSRTHPKGSSGTVIRPPYDPLLIPELEEIKSPTPEVLDLVSIRKALDASTYETVLKNYPNMDHVEYSVPGPEDSNNPVILSVFKDKDSSSTNRPAVYYIHGGGQIAGNRFGALDICMQYAAGIDIVFVSVEYRVAPENPAPAALKDSYAGLVWTAEHATELGIDANRILLIGGSGGAPITAGCAMLCRNETKPYPAAQMLLTPMLDDRDQTVSTKQFARDGPWCGTLNRKAWDHVLGSARGKPGVSELVSPARATDLSGLPRTFIDVGECEIFRDEAVAFASQLWACGVSTELHVWPGAYHGFDLLYQRAPVAKAARDAKINWVSRVFGAGEA